MLSFQSQPQIVQEMQNIINSGKFFSITFIKADNSIRFVNGHKHIHQSNSPETENRGKYNRLDKNILLIWDNNKVTDMGEKGAYISAKLDRILFFKSGDFVRDFTNENQIAMEMANISPEQLNSIKDKMKLNQIIQEELLSLFNK